MTVIAYSARHRVMAADSRSCSGDICMTTSKKIVRLASGALLGMAGDGDARDFVALISKARVNRMPKRSALADLECDVVSLLVFATGEVFRVTVSHTDSRCWGEVMAIAKPFAAVGNGSDFALGAMSVGADPRKAVEAACEWAVHCSPPVQVEKL